MPSSGHGHRDHGPAGADGHSLTASPAGRRWSGSPTRSEIPGQRGTTGPDHQQMTAVPHSVCGIVGAVPHSGEQSVGAVPHCASTTLGFNGHRASTETLCFNGDTVLQRRHCASTTRPPFDSASGTDGAYAAKLKQGHLRQGFRPQRFTGVHHARRIFDRLAVACWSTDQQFAGSPCFLTFLPVLHERPPDHPPPVRQLKVVTSLGQCSSQRVRNAVVVCRRGWG